MNENILTVTSIKTINNVLIKQFNGAIFYSSGLMIDADGAYKAYHPDNKSGLDYLANAGKEGNWWGIVTDTGESSGKPIVQKETDPAPGFYVSSTSMMNPAKKRTDPLRYVDSSSINYIVLPNGFLKEIEAKTGDFSVVINETTGVYVYAIFADVGPKDKIGEGSIALAANLGIKSSPKNGGTTKGITYIVFPKSSKGWQQTQAEINKNAAEVFKVWGGMEQAKKLIPTLNK